MRAAHLLKLEESEMRRHRAAAKARDVTFVTYIREALATYHELSQGSCR
jgi:hypothetical protein